MKKIFTGLLVMGTMIFLSVIGGLKADASVNQIIPNDYYYISPISNPNLIVSPNMTLQNPHYLSRLEFFYVQSENAYVINQIPPNAKLRWTGNLGVGNLQFSQDPTNHSFYWIVEKDGDAYLIKNKQDPTMVWDVHNYQTTLGGQIKLEKEHHPSSAYRSAQLFQFKSSLN